MYSKRRIAIDNEIQSRMNREFENNEEDYHKFLNIIKEVSEIYDCPLEGELVLWKEETEICYVDVYAWAGIIDGEVYLQTMTRRWC